MIMLPTILISSLEVTTIYTDYINTPKKPYDGENMNAYSNNEEDNDEVASIPPTNDEIINVNSNELIPDTTTDGGNIETIDNDKENNEKETDTETDNENLKMEDNDK